MKRLLHILLSLALLLLPLKGAASSPSDADKPLDINEYIFGHIGDAYGWHITTVNEHHISLHLPVILHSKTSGWHVFSSKHIEEGEPYEGFHLNADGKLVETAADGSEVRPLDLSITKNVLSLFINSLLLILIVLVCAGWYRRHDATKEVPRGFVGVIEMLISMVYDDIIKPCVGEDYKRYTPYLLTAFFFIFFNNLMGIVPFFPGGANLTGNIAITFVLAICTFLAINLFGNKHYWKDILWPDVPTWLKVPIPLMPAIEIIGMFTKPFSLMVRLFANILAGHVMLLGVVAVVFLTAKLGIGLNAGLSAISVLFGVFMDILELLVAFIQAYVFTMLSSVFIGMSRQHA